MSDELSVFIYWNQKHELALGSYKFSFEVAYKGSKDKDFILKAGNELDFLFLEYQEINLLNKLSQFYSSS